MTKIKYQDKKLGRPRKGVTWTNNPERVIVAKFDGWCSACFEDIKAGEWVFWSSETKELRHQKCPPMEQKPKEQKPRLGWRIVPTASPDPELQFRAQAVIRDLG